MPSSQQWNSSGSKTSTSKPFPLKIGNSTTIYNVKTETNITNSQVGASKLTLQDSVTARSGTTDRVLATSTDGGTTWSPTKDASGNNILTQNQLKSLQPGGALNKAVKSTAQIDAKSNGASPQQLNQLSNGNAATTNPNSTPQITGTQQDLLSNASVADGGYREKYNKGEIISYPIDRDPEQDYIKFTMVRYRPKPFDIAAATNKSEGIFGERPGAKGKEILGYVSLPIQPNIADANTVGWGDDEINSLDALGQGLFTGIVKNQAEQTTGAVAETVQESLGPLKSVAAGKLAGAATGTNKDLLTRTTGAVVNPNIELLFNGPKLRGFQFNFSLSAREDAEAIVIRKIIRFFKQGMSVKRAASTLFLKAPNTFNIKYVYGRTPKEDHPWINKIKECALQNFTVNYTPAGNYATFEDGAMTQYDITLSFSELDPIYDDDYGIEDTFTDIGY